MRVWLWIVVVVGMAVGAIEVGCWLAPDLVTDGPPTEAWRHTAIGWESARRWSQSPAPWPPLSPVVVAAFQLLASILALLMFERHRAESPSSAGEPRATNQPLPAGS